ncbi:type II toxin-antitoxin system tRNA(fMet)-specific endonuclease VapC [Hippea sp. KM1]|uniref:type II toxin-antitoxin system tRNA(fMet)-specific endonuclease VapC n=1 Tax=Hippea sp. KM1 TaxID=944481 RepID=UPI0018DD6333|nr:type II toxin-antitoxin system VapC family toxin [Hippea sp. KM1]
MLDTNICSYIIRNAPEEIRIKLKEVEQEHELALSSVVVAELFYGAYKKNSKRLINLIESFIENFTIYGFDAKVAEIYGKIRAGIERKGNVMGAYDLQIAAHAISLDAVLVTNNEREFRRIEGLRAENWAR